MEHIKKGDFAVIAIVILAALGIWVFGAQKSTGSLTAVITQDGTVIRRIALDGLVSPVRITVKGEKYTNIIVAEDGKAWFEHSDCPNLTCVNTGALTRAGQTAVCLENRVALYLEGVDAPDAVVS